MKTNELGPRPSDPRTISFERRCFVEDGSTVEYRVLRSALHSGPAKFSDRAEAEAFAKRFNRVVTEVTKPVMRRISWT